MTGGEQRGRETKATYEECLELLHFAFRNVVREADQILKERGLNRAHHRILYFVGQAGDMAMLDLLRILGISRQSLHRPLRELIDQQLVDVRPLASNRRFFTVALTAAGRDLEDRLTGPQRQLFEDAEAKVGRADLEAWRRVMATLAERPAPDGTEEAIQART